MAEKIKFELEYLLKTSPKVLESMINTPSGLSEWYADDVNIKDDVFTFFWDGGEEKARLISKKNGSRVRFQRLEDEEENNECYFEMGFEIDPMTKSVVMSITDFAESDELEESKMLWEQQINDLKRVIGN
jgi:hypothetical protein